MLMTGDEYRASIRDAREVWMDGERNIIKIGNREVPIGRHYRENLLKEIEQRFLK